MQEYQNILKPEWQKRFLAHLDKSKSKEPETLEIHS